MEVDQEDGPVAAQARLRDRFGLESISISCVPRIRRMNMHAIWTASYAELPRDGQLVEFVLGGRETVMFGTYVQQIFRSRWTDYEMERVRVWRPAGLNSSVLAPMAKVGLELPIGVQALRDVA